MTKLNKTPVRIRAKRGTESQITSCPDYDQREGELAYATDTGGFYISDGTQFVLLAQGLQDIDSVTTTGNTTTNSLVVGGLTVDTDTLYVDSTNNNVGIGTTSPASKLTVAGTGNIFGVDNQAVFYAKNSSGTSEPYLWPRWGDNMTYLNYGSGGFHIRNNSSATTMFMSNSNQVSIGTTSTGYTLRVNGNMLAGGMQFQDNIINASNVTISTITNGGNGNVNMRFFDGAWRDVLFFSNYQYSKNLILCGTGTYTGYNTIVGGTTNDGSKFQVKGTSSFSSTTSIAGTLNLTNTTTAMQIGPTSDNNSNYYIDCGNQLYIRANQSASDAYYTNLILQSGTSTVTAMVGIVGSSSISTVYFNTSNTERMRISPSGNLLIGTTTDSGHRLDVVGSINTDTGYNFNGINGWTGTFTIIQDAPNPPINVDVNGGIITNVY